MAIFADTHAAGQHRRLSSISRVRIAAASFAMFIQRERNGSLEEHEIATSLKAARATVRVWLPPALSTRRQQGRERFDDWWSGAGPLSLLRSSHSLSSASWASGGSRVPDQSVPNP